MIEDFHSMENRYTSLEDFYFLKENYILNPIIYDGF
jgi:hypothetical protein